MWAVSIAKELLDTLLRTSSCLVIAGSVRSVIRRNYFLVAHHLLYFVFFLVPVVRDSVWGSKVPL